LGGVVFRACPACGGSGIACQYDSDKRFTNIIQCPYCSGFGNIIIEGIKDMVEISKEENWEE